MWSFKVHPRFGDIDGLRHVNNNTLGTWFEMGRTELFKIFTPDLNLDYDVWRLILVHADYDYLAQMFFDGEVEIRTYILKIGNSSFTVGHEAWQNGELKAKGTCVLIHFNFIEQKSVSLPEDIRLELEKHLIPIEEFGKSI